jgi:Xaa-Pro aminopeptidase
MQANMDRTWNLYSAEGFGIRLEDDLVIQESGEPFNPCATFY